jgi:hypothetical protein
VRTTAACLCLLVSVQLLFSCASEELSGARVSNQAPEVWLSIAPPEQEIVAYRLHIFWGGWDPDGEIDYFEYAITDNPSGIFLPADTTGADKWHRINGLDSVFTFTADLPADSSYFDRTKQEAYEYQRAHTFFIRAVDKEGARSRPDFRSFTARNLSPVINIYQPSVSGLILAQVPPIVTFRWSANDFISSRDEIISPDSVRSIFLDVLDFSLDFNQATRYIRDNQHAPEWTDWIAYDHPGDSGRFWHAEDPLGFGTYLFAVQVKDEAGAINPVLDPSRNMRRIRVSGRTTGPVLTVDNRFMPKIITSTTNTPTASIDIFADISMQFSFTAEASGYGGTVTGYRYGWNVKDVNDDDEWEISFTPFVASTMLSPPRKFFFGTHVFLVEVIDNSGFKSRATVAVNVVPFTMERDLLIVDDFDEGSSPGFGPTLGQLPTDAEHDRFWEDVLQNVNYDVWPVRGRITPIPITTIAKYKAIIWNVWGYPLTNTGAILTDVIMHGSRSINILSPYLEAGGKLLLCGEHPMPIVIDKRSFDRHMPAYPFIFRYELTGNQYFHGTGFGPGEESFAYNDCCVNVVDVAWGARVSRIYNTCSILGKRGFDSKNDGIRVALPVDHLDGAGYVFPPLELRPEVSDPGRYFHESSVSLRTDIYNPPYFTFCTGAQLVPRRSCFEPMYGLGCLNENSAVYKAPIAFWTSRWAHVPNPAGVAARSAVWGFAPVYFNPAQIREAVEIIVFDEWQLTRKAAQTTEAGN